MQSFTQTALLILAFLFIFGICTETYTLIHQSPAAGARNREYSLDTSWGVHRMSNSRKQTSDPLTRVHLNRTRSVRKMLCHT